MRDSFQFIFKSTGVLLIRKNSNKEDELLKDRKLRLKDEPKQKKEAKKTEKNTTFWDKDLVYQAKLTPKSKTRTRTCFNLDELEKSDEDSEQVSKKRKRGSGTPKKKKKARIAK